jgi:glutamyl-Q tRNA(Asp) synthetase
MHWDGSPVYQSERSAAYSEMLDKLIRGQHAYSCSCSRKTIAETALNGVEGPIYNGQCRSGHRTGARQLSCRLKTTDSIISYRDRIQGQRSQNVLKEIGDFVIRRADGFFAYQFAVVVDDAWQNITHVVRGRDLLLSTPRQILIHKFLGLQEPVYAHHPLVKERNGNKLSKSDKAMPVRLDKPLKTLNKALVFLDQPEVQSGTIEGFWEQAIKNWDITRVHHE